MVLYSRKKREGQFLGPEEISELGSEAVSSVKRAMLDNAVYENEASVLRLSGWASEEHAKLYGESIVRVEGDVLQRVHVERDYTKERRDDAPHTDPGRYQKCKTMTLSRPWASE